MLKILTRSIVLMLVTSLLAQSLCFATDQVMTETNVDKVLALDQPQALPPLTDKDFAFTDAEKNTCIAKSQLERKKYYNEAKGWMLSIVFLVIPLWIKPLKIAQDLEGVVSILRQAAIFESQDLDENEISLNPESAASVAAFRDFAISSSDVFGGPENLNSLSILASLLIQGNSDLAFCDPTPYVKAELKVWLSMKLKEAAKNSK